MALPFDEGTRVSARVAEFASRGVLAGFTLTGYGILTSKMQHVPPSKIAEILPGQVPKSKCPARGTPGSKSANMKLNALFEHL